MEKKPRYQPYFSIEFGKNMSFICQGVMNHVKKLEILKVIEGPGLLNLLYTYKS